MSSSQAPERPVGSLVAASVRAPERPRAHVRARHGRGLVLALALAASALFLLSLSQPWWFFRLYAPQYPRGLTLMISLQGLQGDVREIDMLNHYIGMGHLDAAAVFERKLAPYAVGGLALCVVALGWLVTRKWRWTLALAGAVLPFGFMADSFYWLYRFGHTLDPRAPLHIPAFTPQLFGNGEIGQFMTFARPELGFWLAAAGSLLLLAASYLRGRGGVASGAILLALCTPWGNAHAQDAPPTPLPHEAGPIAQSVPPGAVVAEDTEALTRMLADPNGASEIWLRARRYVGDFRITRKLALRGELGAVLQGTGKDTVLQIEADAASVDNLSVVHSGQRHTAEDAGIRAKGAAIVIRNVRVEDTLFGISLGLCPRCELQHVHVQGPGDQVALKGDGIKIWESDDAVVRDCTVDGVRDVVVWYSRRVLLENNSVRRSRYGTHFMYAHDSIVRNSQIRDNVVGIFVMYSSRLHVERNVLAGARGAAGVGIGFKESDSVRVQGNWIVANSTGSYLDETPRSESMPVEFSGNHFAINDVALRFHGVRAPLLFTGNIFHENTTLADVEGGGDALAARFRNNRFSDYVGYDLDADGIGDVAYQLKRLSGELVATRPTLAFFRGTVAMALLDALATAIPVFASRLLLEDPEPAFAEITP